MPALRTTLDCKEAETWLSAWLDEELVADDRALLEAHLASCRACSAKGDEMARLKDALRRGALLMGGAPDHLVARVQSSVQREARRARLGKAARGGVAMIGVVAAAVVVAKVAPLPQRQDALLPVIAESAERHQLDVPVDVASPDPVRVQAFLRPRVGHDIAVPRLDAQGYGLLGGRIVDVSDHRAAQLVYMGGLGRRLSVVAVPDPSHALARALGDSARRRASSEGLAVEVFGQGDVLYSIVADIEQERLGALVDALTRTDVATAHVVQAAAMR